MGISDTELAAQAVVNTLSSLAQLWYENHPKVPTDPTEIKSALAAQAAGKWAPPAARRGLSDREKLDDIQAGLVRLLGRKPSGLMQWTA